MLAEESANGIHVAKFVGENLIVRSSPIPPAAGRQGMHRAPAGARVAGLCAEPRGATRWVIHAHRVPIWHTPEAEECVCEFRQDMMRIAAAGPRGQERHGWACPGSGWA